MYEIGSATGLLFWQVSRNVVPRVCGTILQMSQPYSINSSRSVSRWRLSCKRKFQVHFVSRNHMNFNKISYKKLLLMIHKCLVISSLDNGSATSHYYCLNHWFTSPPSLNQKRLMCEQEWQYKKPRCFRNCFHLLNVQSWASVYPFLISSRISKCFI